MPLIRTRQKGWGGGVFLPNLSPLPSSFLPCWQPEGKSYEGQFPRQREGWRVDLEDHVESDQPVSPAGTAWSDGSATVTDIPFLSPLPNVFYFPASKVAGECHTLGQACGSCPWLSRWYWELGSSFAHYPEAPALPTCISLRLPSSLPSGLGETGSLLSRAVPPLCIRHPRLALKDAETGVCFSHGASVPSICLLGPDCLGKLPLPFVCIINHLHRALKLSSCRPPMCQAPASLYNLLIRHLPVVNPSPCLPKLSFLDLAFQPLRGFSPSAGSWISAPFPPLRSHWSLSASSPLFPANLSIPICTS